MILMQKIYNYTLTTMQLAIAIVSLSAILEFGHTLGYSTIWISLTNLPLLIILLYLTGNSRNADSKIVRVYTSIFIGAILPSVWMEQYFGLLSMFPNSLLPYYFHLIQITILSIIPTVESTFLYKE